MSQAEFQLRLSDPRLAVHATSALPAWLWLTDGTRILWANPVGARVFGATNGSGLTGETFGPADPHRRQVAQLADRLLPNGAIRLERLRGFGAPLGMLRTCSCARFDIPDGSHGIMVAATQPAGRTMPLVERLQHLVEGIDIPVAAFARDGMLVGASDAARALLRFGNLSEAGLDDARSTALTKGRVETPIGTGRMVLQRVGAGADVGLVALIAPAAPVGAIATALLQTPRAEPAPQPVASRQSPVADYEPPGEEPAEAMRPDPDVGSREPSPTIEAVADGPAEPSGGEVLPAHDEPVVDTHHHPLRFTWQMDADGRFSLGSGEFTRLIGAGTAAAFGRQWCEIAERFALDPDCHIAKAIATHDTWSGITLNWPVDGGSRLPVELSGLPVLDRTRNFAGYRGFGVCRDLDGLTRLAALRRFELLSQVPPRPPSSKSELTKSDVTSSAATELPASAVTLTSHRTDCEKEKLVETPPNVVPFRPIGEAKSPGLTPVENSAFDELARQLSVRLDRDNGTSAETPVPSETSAVAIEPSQGQPVPVAPHDQVEWLALPEPPALGETRRDKMLLDLLPTGILIYRLDRLLYANPAFLECVGYSSLHALEQAGGLDALYVEAGVSTASSTSDAGTPVRISASAATVGQASPPATDGRLFTISWDGDSALALIFSPAPTAPVAAAAAAAAPPNPPPAAGHASAEDLGAILESEVQQARRLADRAANVKADMLARISHEVRTPLNAIIGFAEVMIGERFGALGNELYVEYMKDIRASGERVIVIIDELLELSRIETGKLDLTFADQNLNDIVESCVAVMQPQANRERIIIRTSLAHLLPPVVADARALRQITLNLIGNSMHLANAGGQVIVSTALTDCGEVALRVRDTGHGLNDDEVAAALETAPPSDQASGGPAVNLSLTKALVEANRAQFHLKTCAHSGTLIEVVFSHAMARA